MQNSSPAYVPGPPISTCEATGAMTQPKLTRRRLLDGAVGLTVAGFAGCIGAPTGIGQQQLDGSQSTDQHAEADDQPGHGDEPHGHDLVSEPTTSREVAVNTARFEDSTEYHFDPHVTWVEVGGTVTWRLESGIHSATAYHPGNDQPRLVPEGTEAWDSGTLSEAGETFSHTFNTEGVYHYLCRPHEQFGMIATVIVGEPHLDDQRALQSLPENKPEKVHGKLEELNSMVRAVMGGDLHEEGTTTEDDHHDEEAGHHGGETATEDDHHGDDPHSEG